MVTFLAKDNNELFHYGTPRRSGRYPWGSGDQPFQSSGSFLAGVQDLRSKGMSDAEIAKGLGMSTTELRSYRTVALSQKKHADILMVRKLKDKGYSNVAIQERTGLSDGTVRNYLKEGAEFKSAALVSTADMLKSQVDEKGIIDVGKGVSTQLGLSNERLQAAIALAEADGYVYHDLNVVQPVSGHASHYVVLAKPGMSRKDVFNEREHIRQIDESTTDMGLTYVPIQPPKDLSSKRVKVRYAEDGGIEEDGLIYLRPGKDDLSMGGSNYAQVRISVDGTHYLKGMAIYKDDMPDGVDVIFNTNKSKKGNTKKSVMKEQKDDPDNPFGAQIKPGGQILDSKGKVKSVVNIVNEEGDWDGWSKNLASQMLSKQSPSLARSQLDITYSKKKAELDEILSMTNPTVKAKLLESYSDDVDSAAVHLKAAALPRQATKVLIPTPSMKDTEVYAPTFRDGERIALVRYPHGGTFEIPELTVNNRNQKAKKLLGTAKDAIGINSKVAERLSGADFDGDFVLAIPNNRGSVKSTPPLEGLKDFDPKSYAYPKSYKAGVDFKKMTDREKGMEMGLVSNLITDMTIKGADSDELARAVRHSMVVIDAQKHDLNYKQSEVDNNIPDLRKKYQGRSTGGASTLISRATSTKVVEERKPRTYKKGGPIDKETGALKYEPTGNTYVDKHGKTQKRLTKTTKLADTDDAYSLASGSVIEDVYAEHSNKLKALANRARKESLAIKPIPYSPSAKKTYAKEVSELTSERNRVYRNKPKERQAQLLASNEVAARRRANPDMDADDLKKVKTRALANARYRVGSDSKRITITEKQWEAIQAGAISQHMLREVLDASDLDVVKKMAMPRERPALSASKQATAKSMLKNGYTQADVADALGVSVSTINDLV